MIVFGKFSHHRIEKTVSLGCFYRMFFGEKFRIALINKENNLKQSCMTFMSLSFGGKVILPVAQSIKKVYLEQWKRLPLCQNLFACVKKERNFLS